MPALYLAFGHGGKDLDEESDWLHEGAQIEVQASTGLAPPTAHPL
jgi:hypothetical protein